MNELPVNNSWILNHREVDADISVGDGKLRLKFMSELSIDKLKELFYSKFMLQFEDQQLVEY